jgi:hypothetical protein
MSLRSKWQKLGRRDWAEIRSSSLAHIPSFPTVGSRPDPGLEHLVPLLEISFDDHQSRFPDVTGLRVNAMWEAVFLFHKCSHTKLAAHRLGRRGMSSWSLFNAYHSAFLGAKGIMGMLGVSFPNLRGRQVAVDLFPEPNPGRSRRGTLARAAHDEFLVISLPALDHRNMWEAFQRVLRMSTAECWDKVLVEDLLQLSFDEIASPRNRFLYRAHFWPLGDLCADEPPGDFDRLFGEELDVSEDGFLLRLCFTVYRLFEQLMGDLAQLSGPIQTEFDGSRCLASPGSNEVDCYTRFLASRP